MAEARVAEVLVQFTTLVGSDEGLQYTARACGREMADGKWQGWIEFLPVDGGEPLRTPRETTQPKRQDALYWATGLTPVYLEGALRRAQTSGMTTPEVPLPPPVFDGPADEDPVARRRTDSIMDPFSVYRNGEGVLRRQLAALSSWHLVNIIEAHALSHSDPSRLERMTEPELVELIVAEVLRRVESRAS